MHCLRNRYTRPELAGTYLDILATDDEQAAPGRRVDLGHDSGTNARFGA